MTSKYWNVSQSGSETERSPGPDTSSSAPPGSQACRRWVSCSNSNMTWSTIEQAGQALPGSDKTGQQDKHLYPKDNIYPRNEFGLLLNNVFLIDNNGTDCGRDKEEEIYITSASVIELDCKKCADNDSYDSGIYNASTNTGNNTDLPQNLCYNILPHMKDQLSNCQSSVSIRLFPTFLWKFLISCRH